MSQQHVQHFLLLILQPSILEPVQEEQVLGGAKGGKVGLLHEEDIHHVLEHPDAGLEKVKLMMDQHGVDNSKVNKATFNRV